MKTIAQFAKAVGVSHTTIYRKLEQAVKQGITQCLTVKQGNITYITQEGEDFLYSCFPHVKQDLTDVEQALNTDKPPQNADNEEILFLREQLEKTQDELNTEREHSRTITKQLVEITRNNQILLKTEQDRAKPALPAANDEPPHQHGKRRFFGLFRRRD